MSRNQTMLTLTAAFTAATMLAAPALAAGSSDNNRAANGQTSHKIGICHATGSATNPFVFINVDTHAVQAHTKHHDGRDIIGAKSANECPKAAVVAAPKHAENEAPKHAEKESPKHAENEAPKHKDAEAKPQAANAKVPGKGDANGQVLAAQTVKEATPTVLPDTGSSTALISIAAMLAMLAIVAPKLVRDLRS